MKCLVFSARRYSFNDDQGQPVNGVKLFYLTGDVSAAGDTRGAEVMNISGPLDLWPQVGDLPGIYDVDFRQRPGRNGKPSLQVAALTFIEKVALPV
jgi:hypothetical protein